MNRWLFKSDPETYGWKDLAQAGKDTWDGVANPVALKNLRKVQKGDEIFIYETGDCKSIAGIAHAVSSGYPDPYDPKAVVCDLKAGKPLVRPVTLAEVKANPALKDWELARLPRLSVMPVSEKQWQEVLKMANLLAGQ